MSLITDPDYRKAGDLVDLMVVMRRNQCWESGWFDGRGKT
jgi:hypothetical protein